MEHKGRTALVTGGTGGLGVVECEALAREGANVLMLDVKEGHKADEINATLPADAGKVRFIACDLANPQATKDLAVQLDAEAGGIDIMINNAAINPLKPIDGYDLVLVADGHTTSVRPQPTDFIPPDQSIVHHNEIYRHVDFPDRRSRRPDGRIRKTSCG